MGKYIFRRLLFLIPVSIGVSLLIFLIMAISPGDPARMKLGPKASTETVELLREKMGLNAPIPVQYVKYIYNIAKGDFGKSYISEKPVIDEIVRRYPYTLRIAVLGVTLSIIIGIPIGIISAVRKYSLLDGISVVSALVGNSIPQFWLGLMFIILFSLKLKILPSNGVKDWSGYVLPSLTIACGAAAYIMRTTRSSMMEVMKEDYIRTASAKGVKESQLIIKHALRNALIPVATVSGMFFGTLLGGTLIVETVFAIPGIGTLLITAVRAKDIPVVMGVCIVIAVSFSLVNLLVDIMYAFLDPRIKAQYSKND
jgi:peptide/nickel transport system permease protein